MAHIKKTWDKIFEEEKILPPIQEDIPKIADIFKENGAKKVLDLACGSGKHTVYLAEQGFAVYGIDISEEGIKKAKQWLKKKNLCADLVVGSIYKRLPYEDNFFDAVICIQSINHARIETIRRAIKEIERILKPKGFIFITTRKKVPKKQRLPFEDIAPHTYIPLEGREKGLVHYLFTKESLRKEFKSFKIDVWVDSRNDYYCLLGKLKDSKKERI